MPIQNNTQSMGSSNVVFNTQTRFDTTYVKNKQGVIKIVEIILDLLGFICIQSSAFWSNWRGVYFNVTAHLGLWFSVILLLLYMFHLIEKYHNMKWLQIEMIGCGLVTFLYLIASTIVVAFGTATYSAAGFFGYLAMVLYGFEAFTKFQAIKCGELAQGSRVITKQTHVTTPPALH
ncbi:plasmolipin-like [Pieris rapae]|uniref:plasmolipin-like n=1 Tax=Pieris rapae TaxID=64459 RepID=UPI001E27D386|nr:plasmolipin-like [Pieris rapae]